MSEHTLGLLYPGEMGSSVGASARAAGARVVWASQGRGPATHERAVAAELEDLGSLETLLGVAEVVILVLKSGESEERREIRIVSGLIPKRRAQENDR